MSEVVWMGIAKSVVHVLTSPALNEFKLLWGHEKQFKKLERTIAIIEKVQLEADRRQVTDLHVQECLKQLKLELLEVDDLLDLISAKHLHEKARTGSKIEKQVLHLLSKPRNFIFFVKTAHKVKGIRDRLDSIASNMTRFNFLPVQTEQSLLPYGKNRNLTHSALDEKVIGREKEREDIVKMLLPEGSQELEGDIVSVVAVIGIGGIGKTTLAKLVHNDDRVGKGFDLCIWSSINYFCPLDKVLVELIKPATRRNVQNHDLDTLQYMFREVIQGKRFLLVLDNVWDESRQNWHNLKVLLDSGKTGSMVLATTRSIVVARAMNRRGPYYHLEGLSDESAWSLFEEKAFSGDKGKHGQDLEELGRQIVKKCANVPLAIVTVGSSLQHKEKKEWVSLLNEELSKAVPGDYIMHILKISYNEFPYPVKSCFAYCALFPKGYRFEKEMLVRLWIAQGYVQSCPSNSSKHQRLEDIAEEYFKYLVDRCFFSDFKVDLWSGIEEINYRMHDLVHDLAMEVAKLESVFVDKTTLELSNKTIRHVSIFDEYGESCVEKVCSFSRSKNIRTCIINPLGKSRNEIDLEKLISCFRRIRVLCLGRMKFKEIPASIENLIHLRYLDLSFNYMETLPNSICSLHHLQSLILEECRFLIDLPSDLGKLLSLKHLVLKGCDDLCEMPRGLAALTSLMTLDKLIIKYCRGGLKYLECLENVSGHLEIVVFEDGWKDVTVDVQKSRFSRNKCLDTLHINFRQGQRSTKVEDSGEVDTLMDALEPPDRLEYLSLDGFGGKKISAWVMRLGNLVTLRIRGCHVCVELPPLSRLESLKELRIEDMSSMLSVEGSGPYDPKLFFPSLETLTMLDMPNLRGWWLEEPNVLPTFPRLVKVNIEDCPKLTTCVPWFSYVKDLELTRVGEYVLWQGLGSSALKKLEISVIEGLRRIEEAQIRHLSALQTLLIWSCEQLETVSCSGLAYLTSLEQVWIEECAKVKLVDVDDNHEKTKVLSGYLSRLEVVEIPNVNMWFFNRLRCTTSLQKLYISDGDEEQQSVSVKDEEEMMVPWGPLHNLEDLRLHFGEITRNKSLLKGLENLTCLQKLSLSKCKELHMPWRALLSLKHLAEMEIKDVEKVIAVDYDSQMQPTSSNLRELTVEGGSGEWLPDIPWKFLPSLKELHLMNITDMKDLPDGIQHLTALRNMDIRNCQRVVSLPSWMSSLSLSSLSLQETSEELNRRCQNPEEDWPLILHIPDVTLDFQEVAGAIYLFSRPIFFPNSRNQILEDSNTTHTADIAPQQHSSSSIDYA